jgi:hypothetical protein
VREAYNCGEKWAQKHPIVMTVVGTSLGTALGARNNQNEYVVLNLNTKHGELIEVI